MRRWGIVAVMGVVAAVAACTGKYIRETSTKPFAATDEQLARGAYLVNNVASCGACHSGRENGEFTGPESTEQYLSGGYYVDEPAMKAHVWFPNLTPDEETGLGNWTDDEIARAIRDGIDKDGNVLAPMMPYGSYQNMSDEDVQAIVAYLRTIPAVKNDEVGQTTIKGPMKMALKMGVTLHDPAVGVEGPDMDDPVARGEYILQLGHCGECHSMGKRGPRKDRWLAGSDIPFENPEFGKVWAPNLTPDEATGLGKYGADEVKEALRTGHRLDGEMMAPPMSMFIPHLSGMHEDDLDALVAYLQSVEPMQQAVPERQLSAKWKKILEEKSAEQASAE